jgi:hypothetical protein
MVANFEIKMAHVTPLPLLLLLLLLLPLLLSPPLTIDQTFGPLDSFSELLPTTTASSLIGPTIITSTATVIT